MSDSGSGVGKISRLGRLVSAVRTTDRARFLAMGISQQATQAFSEEQMEQVKVAVIRERVQAMLRQELRAV